MSEGQATLGPMPSFNPWRSLRTADHLTVHWVSMAHSRGLTDGHSTIYMHPELLQVERRSTLTHELIHAERGHTAACSPREEASVRAETARRLIPIGRLLDALAWAHSWDEAADALWVTVEVFTDRLKNLTDDERALIDDLATRVDRGA